MSRLFLLGTDHSQDAVPCYPLFLDDACGEKHEFSKRVIRFNRFADRPEVSAKIIFRDSLKSGRRCRRFRRPVCGPYPVLVETGDTRIADKDDAIAVGLDGPAGAYPR